MEKERIREEAATWVVRLADSSSDKDRIQFEAWRAQSVDHDIAYLMAAQDWQRLDRVKALFTPEVSRNPDALFEEEKSQVSPAPRARRPQWLAVAASLLVFLAVGTIAVDMLTASQAYATGIGQRKKVVLQDGSTVELNTDSKIEVRFAGGIRSVRLVKGEAAFHVANDTRPFLLKTSVVHLNTQMADMSVRLIGNDARVTVQSGAAFVSDDPAPNGKRPVSTLGPGSETVAGPDGVRVETVASVEMNRLLAWRKGGIALSGQTLGEAADEFNRYNEKKIEISDAKTRSIRVGGYFLTSDVDRFVSAVTGTFPVKARQDADGNIVLFHQG